MQRISDTNVLRCTLQVDRSCCRIEHMRRAGPKKPHDGVHNRYQRAYRISYRRRDGNFTSSIQRAPSPLIFVSKSIDRMTWSSNIPGHSRLGSSGGQAQLNWPMVLTAHKASGRHLPTVSQWTSCRTLHFLIFACQELPIGIVVSENKRQGSRLR